MNEKRKGITPIFMNALMFWIVKFIIMVVIYLLFVSPYLQGLDTAIQNFVNIAYAFLTVFVVFGLKYINVKGVITARK